MKPLVIVCVVAIFLAIALRSGTWLVPAPAAGDPQPRKSRFSTTPSLKLSSTPGMKSPDTATPPAPASEPSDGVSEPTEALSREAAKAHLQQFVKEFEPAALALPELDFQPEATAPPDERNSILAYRQKALEKGNLLIVARMPDGSLHFDETQGGGDFPRDFFPPHVRQNLTEQDWEDFQVAMTVATMKKSLANVMARKERDRQAPSAGIPAQ